MDVWSLVTWTVLNLLCVFAHGELAQSPWIELADLCQVGQVHQRLD